MIITKEKITINFSASDEQPDVYESYSSAGSRSTKEIDPISLGKNNMVNVYVYDKDRNCLKSHYYNLTQIKRIDREVLEKVDVEEGS